MIRILVVDDHEGVRAPACWLDTATTLAEGGTACAPGNARPSDRV